MVAQLGHKSRLKMKYLFILSLLIERKVEIEDSFL